MYISITNGKNPDALYLVHRLCEGLQWIEESKFDGNFIHSLGQYIADDVIATSQLFAIVVSLLRVRTLLYGP